MRLKCRIATRIKFWEAVIALCTILGLCAFGLILFDWNQKIMPGINLWHKGFIIVVLTTVVGFAGHRVSHWKEEQYRLFSELGINDLWSDIWEYSQWRDFWNPKVQTHISKYPQDLQPRKINLAERYGFKLDL